MPRFIMSPGTGLDSPAIRSSAGHPSNDDRWPITALFRDNPAEGSRHEASVMVARISHGVRRRTALLFTLAVTCVCCSRSEPGRVLPIMSGNPSIDRLEPASGWAGQAYPITVTIYGSRFTESDNSVTFGSLEIADRPSSNGGTQIVFSVPKVVPSGGEVPPMVLRPSEYEVRVTNANGTSEPAVFTLTRPGV